MEMNPLDLLKSLPLLMGIKDFMVKTWQKREKEKNQAVKVQSSIQSNSLIIAFCNLKGDDTQLTYTNRLKDGIYRELNTELNLNVDISSVDKIINSPQHKNDETKLKEEYQRIFQQHSATLLLRGECTTKEIELFIVKPNNSKANRQVYSWEVEKFTIPAELPKEILKEICASILNWCDEIIDTEKAAHFHAPNIKGRLQTLENLSAHSSKLPIQQQFELLMTEALNRARLGEERSDTKELEQAIELFVKACEFTQEHQQLIPLSQAIGCLGTAQMNLARLTDNNVDLLNFAIHNFQEGLRLDETIAEQLKIASSIEKDLRQIIQNKIDGYSNLGITYSALAGKINDSFLAEKGVEALKHALILGKEHCINDLEIGHLKMNLGVALDELGRLNQDKLMLTQAIHTNKEALTIFETDKTTQYWARTNHNLGIAQERLGRVDKNIPLLKSAVEAYNEALKIWDLNRYPANFAGTNKHLGKTLQTLGLLEENRFILIESKRAFQKALTIFKSLNNFNECEKTRLCLNSVKANLRELATETLR